jgi:hypothetical protein
MGWSCYEDRWNKSREGKHRIQTKWEKAERYTNEALD